MKTIILIAFSLSIFVTGCQPNETTIEKIIEKPNDEKVDKLIEVNDAMTDEELADSGEQLLTFYTFPLAEKAFKMALLKNPNNIKAQFYTEGFLKIHTVNKGILNRIKPFIRKQGRLKDLEKMISELPNVAARKYLLDGTEDIKNMNDIQNYLFEVQNNWNNFRKWLIANYDKSLTLNLDPMWLLINSGIEGKHSCSMIDEESGKAICNYNTVFQKKLSPVDMMGLRQMVGGIVLMYTMYTSYNFDGTERLSQIDPHNKFTPQQSYQYLVDINPSYLALRQKNMMKEVLNIGSDLTESAKYALKHQQDLCPKGLGLTRQRVGFLFHDGICLQDKNNGLEILETALKGPTKALLTNSHGAEIETRVDYLAWFRNPIADLKTIGPAEYDSCGRVKKLLDKTVGGIFVDKNGDDFMIGSDVTFNTPCETR